MSYTPADDRYERMSYRRCGASGLLLPAVSLGLWHNFGHDVPEATGREICRTAFDHGITHFDLANNYGPPPGSAESAFGRMLKADFAGYRDELVISSKAGYLMWPGPYGQFGSRKYPRRLLRPEPEADGARLRRHLLLPPLRPGHAARGDDGRARSHRPLRARALRRHLLLRQRVDARGGGDPRAARHAVPDPPAELQPPEPLGRARRAEGHPRRARHRLDRVHAARPGHADGEVPRRHPRGQPGDAGEIARPELHHAARDRVAPRAEPHRRGARADARADGDRVGAPDGAASRRR